MKVSIYNEETQEKEQEIFLKLEKQEGLDVFLIAVDSTGVPLHAGSLLRIHPDLEISRCCCISKKIGVPLTSSGQLKIRDID